jgi:hypothetical protein
MWQSYEGTYGIATKRLNISLDPFQRQKLVLYAKIAIDSSLVSGQEPQRSNTVIDIDLNGILGSVASCVHFIGDASCFVAAAKDPYLDRQFGLMRLVLWDPDVKEEAVLALLERAYIYVCVCL